MYTISYARDHAEGFAVKLRYHPTGELRENTVCRLQIIPFEALDEASTEVLEQYAVDCLDFGTYNQTEGKGSSNYYSLAVEGNITLGELTEREIDGKMSVWYEGFEHGALTLTRSNPPREAAFRPQLDAVPAQTRRGSRVNA